jgi:putative ABC transport system permease protein
MYEADRRWQTASRTAALFAVFIACMGLFGLSAINASNRTKEIGIRKVLGAEVGDIFVQLSRGFFGVVGVAILVATPVAWWVMNRWLEDFAYRIELRWWMFFLVGVVVLLIALVTVSYQTVKAALANPVDSLRTE